MLCEPWPLGRLLRHFWFFPPDAAQPNQSERVSRRGPIACNGEGAMRPGLDAGASGDYLASPSRRKKRRSSRQPPRGCQGSHRGERPPGSGRHPGVFAGELARRAPAAHSPAVKDQSTYNPLRLAGVWGCLTPRGGVHLCQIRLPRACCAAGAVPASDVPRGTGRAQRRRCLPFEALGADRGGKAQRPFERVAEPTGGQNIAWPPSARRGQSSRAAAF